MIQGLLILFAANFLGGAFTPLFVKLGVREIPPLTFTFLRFLTATLVFLPFFLNKRELLKLRDIKIISFYSILFSLNVGFFSLGMKTTNTIISQILYTLTPLVVGVLSHFILQEKFTQYKIIGSVIAFVGVLVLIFESSRKLQITSLGDPIGNFFVFLAVVSWSSYIVYSRRLTKKYMAKTTSFISFATTVFLLIPFVFFELLTTSFRFSNISNVATISIFGSGIFSSALMFFLVQLGIKKTSAYTASLFMYLAPFFSSITAIPLLGEKVTSELFLGGLLIILGVFIATTLEHIIKTGRVLK